jgi:hypothetical protein
MNMQLCPGCGNPYEETEKYCPCCGTATGTAAMKTAASNPADTTYLFYAKEDTVDKSTSAGEDGKDLPAKPGAGFPTEPDADSYDNNILQKQDLPPVLTKTSEPDAPADETPGQPIWVTNSLNQPLDGSIDESFMEDPISDDSDSLLNSPLNSMKSNSSYYAPVETDIFDDVADSASSLYSNMSPKVKRIVLSLIVGTLLSLIPIIYAACSQNTNPTAGTYVQASTSTAGAIIQPSGSTASNAK